MIEQLTQLQNQFKHLQGVLVVQLEKEHRRVEVSQRARNSFIALWALFFAVKLLSYWVVEIPAGSLTYSLVFGPLAVFYAGRYQKDIAQYRKTEKLALEALAPMYTPDNIALVFDYLKNNTSYDKEALNLSAVVVEAVRQKPEVSTEEKYQVLAPLYIWMQNNSGPHR